MDAAHFAPFDSLTTPLLWLAPCGRVAHANQAAARWLGVSQRRLLGVPAVALEREGQALADALPATIETPQQLRRLVLAAPGSDVLKFADAWLSPSNSPTERALPDAGRWLELHPVDEFQGDVHTQLPQAISASLKGLAHELRNPLAGIKGAAQLLARRADGDARELTGLIESEVERLAHLVDQLLSPAPPRALEPVNIHAVLERVLRLAESEAGWVTRLQRDYDPSLPDLQGDAGRLAQAVWNLVRNAIEAGASNVQLRTRFEPGARIFDAVHAQALRLEIIDDGCGIPAELAEQILLPLVSGRADGTGLGLALAQQVAREHRGALTWRSRPGHTVFTLLLPLPQTETRHD
jgi:two-component system nitrogen regulation sensor histidine kinase GlnL